VWWVTVNRMLLVLEFWVSESRAWKSLQPQVLVRPQNFLHAQMTLVSSLCRRLGHDGVRGQHCRDYHGFQLTINIVTPVSMVITPNQYQGW
jgi:hypothetical protein